MYLTGFLVTMGIKKPFNVPLQENTKHHAKPESNRSKKRRQKQLLLIGDPEAIVQSVEMFRQRDHKRDGRKQELDLTIEKHINQVRTALGRKKDTNLSIYQTPDPSWDELVIEANRLMDLYLEKHPEVKSWDYRGMPKKSTLKPIDFNLFLNSAFHNLTSSGNFIEQTGMSKPKPEILNIKNEVKPVEKSNGLGLVRVIKK
jgi:hypothetical protein